MEKRERERKRNQKSRDDQAKFKVKLRAIDNKLEQAGRKSKFKEASQLSISPVCDQLWQLSEL